MPVSSPTTPSVGIGNIHLSALQALGCLAMRECELRRFRDDAWKCWRRLLASNLTQKEWERKGFKRAHCISWWGRTVDELRKKGLIHPSRSELTDTGCAAAEKTRTLFEAPMPGRKFADYCNATHERLTGRFAV